MLHCCTDENSKFNVTDGHPQEGLFPGFSTVVFTNEGIAKWNESYSSLNKGKNLSSKQAEEVIDFLAEIGAKAFLTISNFQHVSEDAIKNERIDYIQSAKNASKDLPHNLHASVIIHARILKRMSIPDYVKAKLMIQLWENVIRGIVGNSKQYSAEDLSSFAWHCDIMSNKIHTTIQHFIHYQINCHSNEMSIDIDDTFKLSHFINVTERGKRLDTNKILQSITFRTDEEFPGIKAADCIANFFPRILRGKLELSKLDSLKKLFSLSHALDCIHLDKDTPTLEIPISPFGRSVLNAISTKH